MTQTNYSGIMNGDINVLIEAANQIGSELARQLTTSQIRNVFGEVRKIQMNWPDLPSPQDIQQMTKDELKKYEKQKEQAQDAHRRTALLRPKLAYQARAERGNGVKYLQEILDPCLKIIQEAKDDKQRKLYFDRFVDFFEAILAYHKAAGGN